MKTILRIISIILLVLIVSISLAQNRKAGLNSMAFLNVGVGARNVGLGSAATSITNDVNQVFWNPAGSALKDESIQVAFNYDKWIGDLNHNCAAVAYNLRDIGTISLGIITLGVSDIPADRDVFPDIPTLQAQQIDTKTSSTYSYMDMAISLTYAKYLLDNLSLGVSLKYLSETIDDMNSNTFAVDVGSNYNIGNVFQQDGIGIYDWKISAKMCNLGGDIKFYDYPAPIPLTFSIGTSFMPVNLDATKLMILFDGVKPQDGPQYYVLGAEVGIMNMLSLRTGYKISYSGSKDEGTRWREAFENTIEGISFGVGLKVPVEGYNINVDYAYTSMNYFDATHRISIRFGLK
jgi:hypothetical protein